MINLAVRGHDLTEIASPEDLALQIAEKGIHNVQFALGKSFPELSAPDKLNPGMGTYFKQVFSQHQIQVALLSCYCNLVHPDHQKRETILTQFETYLSHAPFFGASMVATETGSILPNMGYSTGNFSDIVFNDLVQVIHRLVKVAEKHRIVMGIEAGLNHPLYSIERVQELLQKVPSDCLGIVLDPTNLITQDNYKEQVALVREAFKIFGEKIVCLHLKDFQVIDGKISTVALGKGLIDYQGILEIVLQYKPYCYVVLEGTQDEAIVEALELLKNICQ